MLMNLYNGVRFIIQPKGADPMKTRSFGWVQNPSNFSHLKHVTQIFDPQSAHYAALHTLVENLVPREQTRNALLSRLKAEAEKAKEPNQKVEFTYRELVGGSTDIEGNSAKRRNQAVADSLIQVTIPSQSKSKPFTDNWTSQGYLSWAVSLGLVQYLRKDDCFSITDSGLAFSRTADGSPEELEQEQAMLLAYPPAWQIMRVLCNEEVPRNKFYLGSKLGFVGENGFSTRADIRARQGDNTTMDEEFLSMTPTERSKFRSDSEGTSDKYARMICRWLKQVKFVNTSNPILKAADGTTVKGFPEYSVTVTGRGKFNAFNGGSKHKRQAKYLNWEFLGTKVSNCDYVRTRRAYIIKELQKTHSLPNLLDAMAKHGFTERKMIINDLKGLVTFGLNIDLPSDEEIRQDSGSVVLHDRLNDFSIPELNLTEELKDKHIETVTEKLLDFWSFDNEDLGLLDLSRDGRQSEAFELGVTRLFGRCGLEARHLGGPVRPDIAVWGHDFGIIVDTKAYGKGYSKNVDQLKEMARYVVNNWRRDIAIDGNWWQVFPTTIKPDRFYYLWVSSTFIGDFNTQFEKLADYNKADNIPAGTVHGGGINIVQLLLLLGMVKRDEFDINDLPYHIKESVFSVCTDSELKALSL